MFDYLIYFLLKVCVMLLLIINVVKFFKPYL